MKILIFKLFTFLFANKFVTSLPISGAELLSTQDIAKYCSLFNRTHIDEKKLNIIRWIAKKLKIHIEIGSWEWWEDPEDSAYGNCMSSPGVMLREIFFEMKNAKICKYGTFIPIYKIIHKQAYRIKN